jgi:hypothetical protein
MERRGLYKKVGGKSASDVRREDALKRQRQRREDMIM